MLAYTGVETVSNLAEEVRDPVRNVPSAYRLVAYAVFAIYFTLPLIALSALPVHLIDGELTTLLALPPEEGGYANDPILGVVQNLGLEGGVLDAAKIYVGVLAATILFIATNAGVIGASRITYSMATYRQIPEIFRRLHPKFKTPWLSILIFAGILPILVHPPGRRQVRRHALLARGDALVHRRARLDRPDANAPGPGGAAIPGAAEPPIPGCRLAALRDLRRHRDRDLLLVILVQNATTRWVGLGWIVGGMLFYAVYRRRVVHEPLLATVKAPPAYGPALALEYRRLLVPVVPGRGSDDALDLAASMAAERGARIAAVTVLEIPLDLPLSAQLPEEEALANRELDEARAIGDSYGISVIPRLVRGRNAGAEIVREAERRGTEIIVIGAPRRVVGRRKRAVFGHTVDYVLKNAPCRVMVTAIDEAA